MEAFGFTVPELKDNSIEVFLADCWDGPQGNSRCQIMATANTALRNEKIELLKNFKNPFDKIDALTQMFSDNDYEYDYNVAFNEKVRKKYTVFIGPFKFITSAITLREGFFDPEGGFDLNGKRKRQSPTFHLLKKGQCVTTANEVCRILRPNGLKCEMVSAPCYCLNIYTGKLEKVPHVYNHIYLPSGKIVEFDTCAFQMERDAKDKGFDIDTKLLYEKEESVRPFVL